MCNLNVASGLEMYQRIENLQRLNEQLKRELDDRDRAEKTLRQSKERLQVAIDAASDAIWDWDIAGKSFFWSDRLCEFFGLEPDAIPCGIAPLHAPNYKTFYKWLHPLDRSKLIQALRNHWKFNHPFRIELRIQKADKSYSWFLIKGKALLDENGRPARMVGLLIDINYRKPTEEKLREAEKIAHIGNWEYNLITQKITWSDEAFRIYGFDPEQPEPSYSELLKRVFPSDVIVWKNFVNRAIRQGDSYEFDFKALRLDGSVRYLFARGQAIFNEKGQVIKLFGTVQDITERKLVEEALRQSEHRFRVAVDNFPHTFVIYDCDRRLQFVNKHGMSISGYPEQELMGQRDEEIFPPEVTNTYLPILKATVQTRSPQTGEYTIVLSKNPVTFVVNYVPLLDEFGKIYQIIGITQDITERKRAEEALRIARNELEIRVEERTKELTTINESLQIEIKISAAAQDALWQSLQKLEETSILLQNVLENLPVGVWIADEKGIILQKNRAAEKIWGGVQYVGLKQYDEYKGWWADTGKQIEASEWAIARAIVKGESSLNEVINIQGFDGMHKTILNSAVPLRNQNAEIIGAIGVNQDITEQRLVEKAFWANQHFIQQIADATPNILYVYDLMSRSHIYVNEAIADILGYSPAEFQRMGENVCNLIHPDERLILAKQHQALIAAKNGEIVENEYRIRHANGEWRWLSCRNTVFARTVEGLPHQILGAAADVTDRKQAEIALIESEKRFRIMADTTPVLIWIVGTDGQCTFFNKPWLDFTGRTLEEEIVNAWEFGLHPEDLQRCLDTYRSAFNARSRFQIEYRLRRADGEYRWLLDTGMPLFSESGEFAGYIGSAIDISDRKTAETALLASEEKFRQLAENINEVFWITDPDLIRAIYVSSIYEQIWGQTRESLYANPQSWLDAIHLEDRERVSTYFSNNGSREGEIEYQIVRPDGEERWIWDRSFPIRNDAGEVYRQGRVSRDITDRKQTQEALRISEERLRIAIQNSPIVLFNQDLELRYTWVLNPHLEVSAEMILGKTDADFLSSETAARLSEIKRGVLETGMGMREEVQINNNREVCYVDLTVEPLRDSAGNIVGITGASVDVSDRKRTEEIRYALEQEKELSQLKLRFFSMASHEFRTPLSTILLSAQVLETCNDPGLENKRLRNIHRIQSAAKNMTHLLEDILTITRAENGKLEFHPKPLLLEDFCCQLWQELHLNTFPEYSLNFIYSQLSLAESEAMSKRLGLDADARSAQSTIACMDEKLLRSILSNLLSNAIKYSPQGGTVNFTVIISQSEQQVIFRIQDEGIGIPQKDKIKLFEAFHRGENVGAIPGSGLGLTVVKKCVELHGGSISVISSVGMGTIFTVMIPLGNGDWGLGNGE